MLPSWSKNFVKMPGSKILANFDKILTGKNFELYDSCSMNAFALQYY